MRQLPEPIAVEEALREARVSINVPDGTTLTLGPFEHQHHDSFRLAEVTTFEDLHRLGFVSQELAEADVIKAVRADDRAYSESLRHLAVSGERSSCSCDTSGDRSAAPITRRFFQDHLIDLLQPHFRDVIRAGDPAVIHPYRHIRSWLSRSARYLVGLFTIEDINIGDKATLTMTPTVQAVYARDINIGKSGKLRFESGNVHVRCKSLNGSFATLLVTKHVRGLTREIKIREGQS